MATSPKKKSTNPKQKKHQYLFLMLLCILSFIVTIYVISEQISIAQTYVKYIESYRNVSKPEDNRTEINSKNSERSEKRVKSISILGERNSGTTWIYE